MAKNRQNKKKNSSKPKFVILGIIVAAIIGIAVAALLSGDETSTQDESFAIDTSNGSPILGSPDAPVTIVEFGDYQCPFCQKWNQETKPSIVKNYIETGKANLVFIDFAIIGPDSLKAHASSYCAAEQGLYWEYHDYLYQNQGHENDGWASAENLKRLATGVPGLDIGAFSQCVDSGKYEDRVMQNTQVARNAGASSTPSFILVGPEKEQVVGIQGAQPYSSFSRAIDDMLAQ